MHYIIFFKSDFCHFLHMCAFADLHWVWLRVSGQRLFIPYLGYLLWSWQSMRRISIYTGWPRKRKKSSWYSLDSNHGPLNYKANFSHINLGENRSSVKNLNWTKTKMTSSMEITFLSSGANMMTLFHFVGVRVVWNRISNSCSFQPWYKNWGSWIILKSYFDFKNGMFLIKFTLYCPLQHARIFKFDALARPYERSRATANEWKWSIVVSEIQIMWKFWISTFNARCARAQRARGHVRTGNFVMLKMTWFVLSFV